MELSEFPVTENHAWRFRSSYSYFSIHLSRDAAGNEGSVAAKLPSEVTRCIRTSAARWHISPLRADPGLECRAMLTTEKCY
jgi:hypothetical protein